MKGCRDSDDDCSDAREDNILMGHPSFGTRFCHGSILAFGTWTALAQTMTLLGGSPRQLSLGALLLLVLAGVGIYLRRRLASPPPERPLAPTPLSEIVSEEETDLARGSARTYVGGFALLALLAWATTPEVLAAAIALLTAGILLAEMREPVRNTPAVENPNWEMWLGILAFLLAIAAISIHRPDADDAMYLNMAVTAVDFPHAALLSFDGSLPDPGVALPEAAYRTHSLEILVAVIAGISKLPAIGILHIGIALWATLLAIFAQAELQKILLPRHWFLGTLVAILVLLAWGETHRSFGNFFLVRIHQGKGILLAAILPLLLCSAVDFMRSPSAKSWFLLLLGVIAATGITSTGLVIAPVAVALASIAMWVPERQSTQRLVGALTTTAYPVMLALLLGLV